MATHIKTIKNDSGDTIDIVVDISSMYGYTGSTPCHSIKIKDLRIKRYKKRTWEEIGQAVSDDHKYRCLPLGKERELHKMQIFLQHITPEQAKAAIREAYEAIAPDTSIIDTAAERTHREGADRHDGHYYHSDYLRIICRNRVYCGEVRERRQKMKVDIFNTAERYNLIYADPPWKQSKGGKKNVRARSSGKPLEYPVCSLSEIKEHLKQVDALTNGNTILFLWTIDKYLFEAQQMAEELGYKLHARMIWDKVTGIPAAFTVRYGHEYLLYMYKCMPEITVPDGIVGVMKYDKREKQGFMQILH